MIEIEIQPSKAISEPAVENAEKNARAHLMLDKENVADKGENILIGARDIGPVRAILPLVGLLPRVKSLTFLSDGPAINEIVSKRNVAVAEIDYGLTALKNPPDIIITSGEVTPGMANFLTKHFENTQTTVVWLEDVPESLKNRTGLPDLVFCFNEESAQGFRVDRNHENIPSDRIHVLGLNPDFLRLLSENPKVKDRKTRRELNISEEATVVTYVGCKSSDTPWDPQILEEVSEILEEIRKETGREIVLIRRDHPGDPYPENYVDSMDRFGGRKIVMAAGSDLINKIQTPDVSCASDLLVGVWSTVYEEAALRGALSDEPGRRGTVAVNRHQEDNGYPINRNGAVLTAYSRDELKKDIQDGLFNQKVKAKLHQSQIKYCSDAEDMQSKVNQAIKLILETSASKKS